MPPLGLPYWERIFGNNPTESVLWLLCEDFRLLPVFLEHSKTERDFWQITSIIKDVKIVAGKSNKSASDDKPAFISGRSTKWVNVDLQGSDVEVLKNAPWTGDEVLDAIVSLVSIGATVTAKPDDRSSGFAAYIIIPSGNVDVPNIGVGGYGGTGEKALRAVLFKYFVCLKENVASYSNQTGEYR